MPTMAQLGELASQLYVGNPSIGAKEDKSGIQFDSNSSTAKSLGLTTTFYLWSGEEGISNGAYGRRFGTTFSYWGNGSRYASDNQAVCLGD